MAEIVEITPNTPANSANSAEKRQISLFEAVRAMSGMIGRTRLGYLLGFGGRRDYNKIFGWDPTITAESMMYMYNRGGIAKRAIDAYPDAVWARPPLLWAEGDDAWTKEWQNLAKSTGLWPACHRLDKLAALGRYAIMVIGTNKPGLETPLTAAERITYYQPYGETSVKIESWDQDQRSPTFGKPIMYRVYPDASGLMNVGGDARGGTTPSRSSFRVHASRVIHVVLNPLEDEVFGQPALAPVWDYLTDLRKVMGSSSESYWIAANRGLQADVNKDMQLGAEDQAALQAEMDDFYNGFRRFIRTKGVQLKELANDTADPKGPFEVLITLIAGTRGIPQRILVGSEAGQLASTQDKGAWAERIEENRSLHVEPRILSPILNMFIAKGLIRAPNEGATLRVLWPEAYRMSPLERGQTAAQTGRVLSYLTKLNESKAEANTNLISRVEQRALLGISTDNMILSDNPEP